MRKTEEGRDKGERCTSRSESLVSIPESDLRVRKGRAPTEHVSAGVVLIRVLHCTGKVMWVFTAAGMIKTSTEELLR